VKTTNLTNVYTLVSYKSVSKPRIAKYLALWLGWAGGCAICQSVAYADSVPNSYGDSSDSTGNKLECLGSPPSCNPGNTHPVYITTDAGVLRANIPFAPMLPDNNPSGGMNGVAFYSWATNTPAVSRPPSVSCLGALVDSLVYKTSVELADGNTCNVTVSPAVG